MQAVTIYTDGGCSPNPGLGGWAAIISAEINGEHVERVVKGAVAQTNMQRMELLAVAEALESLKCRCAVELYSDSQYVVKGMTDWIANWVENGWQTTRRKAVKHVDLWQRILAQTERHAVSFFWTKAHAGDEMNERVDALVKQARDEFEATPTPEPTETPEYETPYRLWIAGSREATEAMCEYAQRVVAKAMQYGWTIVVGDNPQGVDAEVIAACREQQYTRVIVVGIAQKPRNGGVEGGRYVRIGANYTERDQMMAKASDRALFIWNGTSPGTKAGHAFMKSLGKTAHLIDFS